MNNFDWLESWAATVSQGHWVECETQITNLDLMLAERDARIDILNSEVVELKSSTSWKITSPLMRYKAFVSRT